ncbi:NADH-quinone oxidoreductase subunit N [Euzebya tangerina]|uniref:NADH-quinone oxidoreductase subunit N n=1 Tax=Euzebya tangerina TaxID=591198 RepID=UPI000E319164|nr:NADH-quinone oxidoreductase subunit N [Euzebya tangerina]
MITLASPLVLAQAPGQFVVPDFPWAALSPELVLFGVGILVLLIDTAGSGKTVGSDRPHAGRLQVSFVAGVVILACCGVALWQNAGDVDSQVPVLSGLIALGAVLQFVLTAIWRDRPKTLGALLTFIGFAAGLGVTIWQWTVYDGQLASAVDPAQLFVGTDSLLGGMVAVDGVALFSRFSICLAGMISIPIGFAYMEDRQIHRGEYYPLLLFAATGMTLLASSNDLIMVFIAVEILSLALYVMSGIAKRDLNAQESAVKYFMLGAFSSAILLYGIALVYGVTGSTNIPEMGVALSGLDAPTGIVIAAMVLMLVGFAFKTGLVPFHFWTPDVYQGAPTPVTGFMAAATKAAAFAAFMRVFVGALAPLQLTWAPVVTGMAVITMLGGAVLAVVQTDVKRILAFSAIAHAGYVAIGLVSLSPGTVGGNPEVGREAVGAMLLYLLIYTFMSIGSFGVIALFERRVKKSLTLEDLRGLGRRYPAPAMALGLFLISLAGIPGTAGFVAKFAVFRSGVEAGQFGLVGVAVVSSVIAGFFYLRIMASMFVEDETAMSRQVADMSQTAPAMLGLGVAAAVTVALGVAPGALVNLAQQAGTFAGL